MEFALQLTQPTKAPMSAARLAAEAAFASPVTASEPLPGLVDIRSWRAAPAAESGERDPGDAVPGAAARPPRVFRLESAAGADVLVPAPVAVAAPTGPRTRRRRKSHAAAPVRIVHAAPSPLPALPDDLPPTARWADLTQTLALLDSTFAEIDAAQAFQL